MQMAALGQGPRDGAVARCLPTITLSPNVVFSMTALPLSFVPDSFGERWPHGVEPAVKICVDPDHMSTSDDMWVIQQVRLALPSLLRRC